MSASSGSLRGLRFQFYDLDVGTRSDDIALLFPGWRAGDERVVVFSPHDDDAVLGAGYAILAARAAGAEVHVFIFSDGRLGYSTVADKETIVAQRSAETVRAYEVLGIDETHIVRFDYPDSSVNQYVGWVLPDGAEASFPADLRALRGVGVTRILVPNRHREHVDHEAVGRIGLYDGPLVGDDVLPDHGSARPVRSYHEYAVWGDFSPEDALVSARPVALRANRAVVTGEETETLVSEAVRAFASQGRVIAGIMDARRRRRFDGRFMELYVTVEPRPTLDYAPYAERIREIDGTDAQPKGEPS